MFIQKPFLVLLLQQRAPHTLGLVIVGLLLGFFQLTPEAQPTPDLVLLLFEGAWSIKLTLLRENWRVLFFLAGPGLMLSLVLSAVIFVGLLHLDWLTALLLAAILSPTDPIAVLGLFRQLQVKIALSPTAYRFRRGHRIRLQVSSGSFPRWNRNLGSDEPLMRATTLRVAEQQVYHDPDHLSAVILPYYVLLGILCGLMGLLYARGFYGITHIFHRLRLPNWVKPGIGGLLVGLIGLVLPQALGMGYGWVQVSMGSGLLSLPLWMILLLPFAKILTTGLTVGSGGSGGIFGPGMVIGGMLGAVVWRLCYQVLPDIPSTPGPFVIVGMMAMFEGELLFPRGSAVIVPGDVVTFLVSPRGEERLQQYLAERVHKEGPMSLSGVMRTGNRR